jgi:serine/threonine protein kinase
MHRVGLAHLDLKPSNVIVRDHGRSAATPVLVDFGLAGRRLRPGCGTASYAAPEVWVPAGGAGESDPRQADVYALGCVAYELLTGELLFRGESDRAIVAAHLAHDGRPAPIEALLARATTRPLGAWLVGCLRQRAADRSTIVDLVAQLSALATTHTQQSWPLTPDARVL